MLYSFFITCTVHLQQNNAVPKELKCLRQAASTLPTKIPQAGTLKQVFCLRHYLYVLYHTNYHSSLIC